MRFYFHLRQGETTLEDPVGLELESVDAALSEAIAAAREIMADRLKAGLPLDGEAFEIRNEASELVQIVRFKDAIPSI